MYLYNSVVGYLHWNIKQEFDEEKCSTYMASLLFCYW